MESSGYGVSPSDPVSPAARLTRPFVSREWPRPVRPPTALGIPTARSPARGRPSQQNLILAHVRRSVPDDPDQLQTTTERLFDVALRVEHGAGVRAGVLGAPHDQLAGVEARQVLAAQLSLRPRLTADGDEDDAAGSDDPSQLV